MITRRIFIRNAGTAIFCAGVFPSLLHQELWAATVGTSSGTHSPLSGSQPTKTLVVIVQRGAMDGLALVMPLSDRYYLEARPSLAIRSQGDGAALRLDGSFGLHPAMTTLKPFWDDKTLAFIHQVGQSESTRSHFDAQDFLESGTPGDKATPDGFLNRVLRETRTGSDSPLRAIALQPSMPRILQGSYPSLSMNSLRDFQIKTAPSQKEELKGFEAMYQTAADQVLKGAGSEAFRSLRAVASLEQDDKKREEAYPKTGIAKRLKEIATLIRAEQGVQVAVTDMGGWDTHVNQGGAKGQLADRFKELSEAIAAFRADLGPMLAT